MIAEHHPIRIDDEQLQVVEAAVEQCFQLRLRGLDRRSAHAGLRHPDGLGHLRNHVLIVARGNAPQQGIQHVLAQRRLVLHRRVGRNLDFFGSAAALGAQSWPLHLKLAVAEHHLACLPAIENYARRATFALLLRTSRHLRGRQLQYGLKDSSSSDIDELIAGHQHKSRASAQYRFRLWSCRRLRRHGCVSRRSSRGHYLRP